jgi:hypothetical protein
MLLWEGPEEALHVAYLQIQAEAQQQLTCWPHQQLAHQPDEPRRKLRLQSAEVTPGVGAQMAWPQCCGGHQDGPSHRKVIIAVNVTLISACVL